MLQLLVFAGLTFLLYFVLDWVKECLIKELKVFFIADIKKEGIWETILGYIMGILAIIFLFGIVIYALSIWIDYVQYG